MHASVTRHSFSTLGKNQVKRAGMWGTDQPLDKQQQTHEQMYGGHKEDNQNEQEAILTSWF